MGLGTWPFIAGWNSETLGQMPDITEPAHRYWAFISYSHRDRAWGDWLHRAIESYRVPRRLIGLAGRDGPVPRRLFPVFRDREELPTAADLGANIQAGLEASRYLIVICSPHAAASRWVDQEIRIFKTLGRANRIICLIVDGEPNATDRPDLGLPECFPLSLRHEVAADGSLTAARAEPIAADMRDGRDGRHNGLLKLVAGLIGLGFDELRQRDRQRQRLRIATYTTGAILVAASLTGVWFAGAEERANLSRQEQYGHAQLMVQRVREAKSRREEGPAALYAAYALRHSLLAGRPPPDPALLASIDQSSFLIGSYRTDAGVSQAASVADGAWIAVLREDGNIAIVDTGDGRTVRTISPGHGKGTVFATTPASSLVATGGADGRVRLWDATSGSEARSFIATDQPIDSITFSRDGTRLAIAQRETIHIFHADGTPMSGPLRGHVDTVTGLAFLPGSDELASIGRDQALYLWDLSSDSGRELAVYPEPLRVISVSPDGADIAIGGWDGSIKVWDLANDRERWNLSGHGQSVEALTFAVEGRLLVSGSRDGTVKLWDFRSGTVIESLAGHQDYVMAVMFSTKGLILHSISRDGDLRGWRINAIHDVAVLKGSSGAVRGLACHPDGRTIFSAGDDGVLRRWNIENGEELQHRIAHSRQIHALALNANGTIVATGGRDRII